jgi:5-formyltetrahydrofolate cyclo-ligase
MNQDKKKELRETIMKKRSGLSAAAVKKNSGEIKKRLFQLNEFKDAQTVLFYVSYDNEVSTHDMIKECLKTKKTVVVPKCDTVKKTLVLSRLSKWEDLSQCSYSILEPRDDDIQAVACPSIDVFIVPGVVFDLKGNRIGHGLGYYDRLLQQNTKGHVVGLAFELQLVDSITSEKHDKRVEKIITEQRIIDCG